MISKFALLALALAFATQTTNTQVLTAQAQGLASPQVTTSKQAKQQPQTKQPAVNAHSETTKKEVQEQTQIALEKALQELESKLASQQLAPGIEQTVQTSVFGEAVELEGDSQNCRPSAPSCVYLPATVEVQVFAKASREKTQDPRTHSLSETPLSLSRLMADSFVQDQAQFMPDKIITVSTGPFLFLANGVSYFLTDLRFTVKLRSENSEPNSGDGSQSKQCK